MPAKNSAPGVHQDPGSGTSSSRGAIRTLGGCVNSSTEGNYTSKAILDVMHGPSRRMATVGRNGSGNALNSGPESVIWVSVCSLREKHGVDSEGRALPLESLGVLHGVIPMSIGLPYVGGEEDMSRMGGGGGDTRCRGIQSSYGVKRKGDGDNTNQSYARLGYPERERDRERGRAAVGVGGAVSTTVMSIADTWRAAGFPYGEQEEGILQAHVSFPGSDKVLAYPSDKVSPYCLYI